MLLVHLLGKFAYEHWNKVQFAFSVLGGYVDCKDVWLDECVWLFLGFNAFGFITTVLTLVVVLVDDSGESGGNDSVMNPIIKTINND